MVKRRSLVDGLTKTPKADPETEKAFVYEAKKAKSTPAKKESKPKPATLDQAKAPETSAIPPEQTTEPNPSRSPLTTRLRADIGAALKRASLERQLAGQVPNTVQDILEEALEPWLRAHGYLK
jgi:hypothetical protein